MTWTGHGKPLSDLFRGPKEGIKLLPGSSKAAAGSNSMLHAELLQLLGQCKFPQPAVFGVL